MGTVHIDASAQRDVDDAAAVMLARIAAAIEQDAQRFAPIDAGELQGSIEAEPPAGNRVRVKAAADHAVYVELGTRHQAAQPYLSPALYRERVI